MKIKFHHFFIFYFYIFYSCESKKIDLRAINNQSDSIKHSIPFPKNNTFTKEDIKNNFFKLKYEKGEKDLNYSLIIPKSVKPISKNIIKYKNGLSSIGKYSSKDHKLHINVYYEKNPQQSIKDWVLNKLKEGNHEIINTEEITFNNIQFIDILSRKNLTITRTTEYRTKNNNYIMLCVFCNEADYSKLASLMQLISSTWQLDE